MAEDQPQGVQFDQQSAQRISNAVRWVERRNTNTKGRRKRWMGLAGLGGKVYIGKLDGALSQGGNATMSIWSHNGTGFYDTGENLTVYDWLLESGAADMSAGKKVVAVKIGKVLIVIAVECE